MRYFLISFVLISQLAFAELLVPVDTETEIFGFGVANTEAEAERAALSSIALKLSANIKVEQKEHLTSSNGQSSSSFEELANISSGRLIFPTYNVVARSDVLNGNRQVVVSFGKQQLLDFYHQHLSMDYQQIESMLTGVRKQTPLNALPLLLEIKQKLQVNESILQVVTGLSADGVPLELHQQHIHFRQQALALLRRGGWQVVSDSRSHLLADLLSRSITENKLLAESETNYQFVLSTREQSAQRNNQFRTKRDIQIELRQQGQLQSVMSRKITLISEPEMTYEATVDFLDNQLVEQFGPNMLFTLLGNSVNEN